MANDTQTHVMVGYHLDLRDIVREVLADVLQTDCLNGATAANCAAAALAGEARRLRRESMIDTAIRVETLARALLAAVPATV